MRRLLQRTDAWLGVLLGASLLVTLALLMLEGRFTDAIPLHLCSVSALAAIAFALVPAQILLDALWYLGMPGAALALLFPAPALSRFQPLLNLTYFVTHALILIIPLVKMVRGMRPRPGKTGQMILLLFALAAVAGAVNRALGTDFLFLSAPPAGTPLESAFAWGYPAYLFFLGVTMHALCLLMDKLAARLTKHDGQ